MRELLFVCSVAIVSSFTLLPHSITTGVQFCGQHHCETQSRHGRTWPLHANKFERDELEHMTVVELKHELRVRGLKVSGVKSELVDRLFDLPESLSDIQMQPDPEPQTSTNEKSTEATNAAASVDQSKTPTTKEDKDAFATEPLARGKSQKAKNKVKKEKVVASGDIDDTVADAKLTVLGKASQQAAEEIVAAVKSDAGEVRTESIAMTNAEFQSTKPRDTVKSPSATIPVITLKSDEDAAFAARLSTMDDVGDRAFEILKNLGLVDDSSIIDPNSPDYDSSRDDEIVDGTIFLN